MASNTSDTWSPRYGTSSFTPSETPYSPSGYSYSSGSPHTSSGSSDSANFMRRVILSPAASHDNSNDSYTDDNSIDEVEAALTNLENDIDDTEQALTEWPNGSSSSHRPTSYTTSSFSGSHTDTQSGSTSYIPSTARPSSTPAVPRLSRITERSEESRSSGAFSAGHIVRPTSTTVGDNLRRSAILSGTTHARSSTEPTGDPTLPPRGRATELIAVFETQTPPAGAHTRATSAPGVRPPSPHYAQSQTTSAMQTTTGYTYGHTSFGFNSRSSSPTKSRDGSTISYTDTKPTMSSLLSPPPLPPKNTESKLRAVTPGAAESRAGSGSYLSPGTQTSAALSSTLSPTQANTGTRTFTRTTDTRSYTTSGSTSVTGTSASTLRRPQTTPRSPLASVRNIVALWKERTPAAGRPTTSRLSTSITTLSSSPHDGQGIFGLRERVQRTGERLRGANLRPGEQSRQAGGSGLPPGFDIGELSQYAQSNEAPLHIGLLWYLNVHAPPPYRWQRCQALLYPHMLLLSWLAPGGGRGIVALDLLNCSSVQSTPSPTHPSARDDVGTVAARLQSSERDGQPLMDMLVPFQMLYGDGIERLAAESLVERQRWVNRLWEAVNRPSSVPNTSSLTRSPTGSIRTILSIDSRTSRSSTSSTGSRSTVYVPPMSTLTDIPDFRSNLSSNSAASVSDHGLARRVSLGSSHHKHTVDDTVIQNQEYVYPGDPRHIPPSRGHSLRRTGSTGDLDQEFARAMKAKASALTGSPVTISSGPSLGRDIFVTPPSSVPRGSDRSRSEHAGSQSDEAGFSARLSGSSSRMRSSISSTYFSQSGDQTATGLITDGTLQGFSSGGSHTRAMTSTASSSPYLGDSQDQSSYSSASPSGLSSLSRAREVRRRLSRVTSYTLSPGYTEESSDLENSGSGTRSYTYSGTPSSQSQGLSGSYTPGSGDYTALSGGYTPGSGELSVGSGSYSPGTGSYTASQSTPESGSQSFTPGSGSYTLESGSYTSNGYSAPSNGNGGISATGISSSSESRSGVGSFTPGTETGYDICPSSDLTGLTPPTTTEEYSSSPAVSSPMYVVIESDRALEVEPEDLARVSKQSSSEYLTAKAVSSRASVASFDTCPTIPSEDEYATADELSSYGSVRGSSKGSSKAPSAESLAFSAPAPASEYVTAPVIPSEESTPRLSSVQLSEEELQSEIGGVPSRVPTIRSLASSAGGPSPLPQNIPLPPSVASSVPSLPPTPLLPALPPTLTRRSSPVSVTDDSRSVISSLSVRDLPALPLSPAVFASEDDESLLGSFSPPMRSRAASTRPPSSIGLSSGFREVVLPPVTSRRSGVPSLIESSDLPVEDVPLTSSSSSSSPPPPSPMMWAGDNETDRSYDSSQLQPSPSLMSIAMPEVPDRSFETSFLRPSASVVSSVNKLSTLPVSPSAMTTGTALPPHPAPVVRVPPAATTRTALPPHPAPVVRVSPTGITTGTALPPVVRESPSGTTTGTTLPQYQAPVLRVSESTSSITPTTQTMSSSSSSFSSGLSSSSPSVVSQPSLSPSLLDVYPLPEEQVEEESVIGRAPRTVSTLLSTAQVSARYMSRSPTPVPIPPRTHTITPEGSVIMSVSTPHGSGGTQQLSLRTEESEEEESLPTPRDIARDIDKLAEDLRHYDDARGLEHKEIADGVKALRDELQDLSQFLHQRRTPPPNVVRIVEERVVPAPPPVVRPSRVLESRSIGDSTEITSLRYLSPPDISESVGAALTRASSITSIGSFLSSHHSDDMSLYGYGYGYPSAVSLMPPISDVESEFDDESSFVSSSDVTLSEVMATLPVRRPMRPTVQATTQTIQEPLLQQPVPIPPPAQLPVQQYTEAPVQPPAGLPVQPPAELPVQPPAELPVQPPVELPVQTHEELPELPPRSPSIMSSVSTEMPEIDLTAPLNAIREQLDYLSNEQASAVLKLESLCGRPYPDVAAVQDKVNRIEHLILDLAERFERLSEPRVTTVPIHQPTTQVLPHPVPPPQTAEVQHPPTDMERSSLSDSEDSSLLRRIESDLLAPRARLPGLSFAEQLQEILSSSANIAPPTVQHPPPLHRFRFEPTEGVVRARSASPVSLESLGPRRMSVPSTTADLEQILRNLPRDQRGAQSRPDVAPGTGEQPVEEEPERRRARTPGRPTTVDPWDQRVRQMADRRGQVPPPQPIFPPAPERPPSAPSSLGRGDRQGQSWYRTPQPDQRQAGPPGPTAQQRPPEGQQTQQQPSHVPVAPGPTYIQLPPIFEQLMTFVRESHVAQTATYQQQQDLARYMRELNQWLARDVNDRQDELRGIIARLDQLGNAFLTLQGRRPESSIGESEVSEVEQGQRPPAFIPQQMPMPMTMPEPQPFRGEGFIPPPPRQQHGVYPGVVPPTPEPDFQPVVPPMQGRPGEHPVQPGRPVIPPVTPYAPSGHATPYTQPGQGTPYAQQATPYTQPGHVTPFMQAGPVIPPPPVISQRPSSVAPAGPSAPSVIPFIPPRPGEHILPSGVIEESDSPGSSSLESTSSGRTRRERSSRSATDRGTPSSTPRPYQQRQPTQLSYRTRRSSRGSSSEGSRESSRGRRTERSRGRSRESSRQHSRESSSVSASPDIIHVIPPQAPPQQGIPIQMAPIPVQPSVPPQSSQIPSIHVVTPSTTQPVPGTPRHPEWQPLPHPGMQPTMQPPPTNIILQQPSVPGQYVQQPPMPGQYVQQQPSHVIVARSGSPTPSGSSDHSSPRSSSHRRRSSRRSSSRRASSPRSYTRSYAGTPAPQMPLPVPSMGVVYPQPLPPPQVGSQPIIIRTQSPSVESSRSSHRDGQRSPSRRDSRRSLSRGGSRRSPSRRDTYSPGPSTYSQAPDPYSQGPTTVITTPGTVMTPAPPAAQFQPIPQTVVQFPSTGSMPPSPVRSVVPLPVPGQQPTSTAREPRRGRSRSRSRSRSQRSSRSPPISYPSEHRSRRGGHRRSRSYSYSPRRHRPRYSSYSRSTSPSYRRVTRYSPPISRSPSSRRYGSRYGSRHGSRYEPDDGRPRSSRYRSSPLESPDRGIRSPPARSRGTGRRSPSLESLDRDAPSPSARSRPSGSIRGRPESPTDGRRRAPESPPPPSERRSQAPSDVQEPRDASPSPLPHPADPTLQRPRYGSRSPSSTRSLTPRFVRAPAQRGRDEPLEVVVPRRDRSPTIVSLGPAESDQPRDMDEEPRRSASLRSASGEPFSARPSLYTPSRRPSVHQSPRGEPSIPPDITSREEEESYRGAPTFEEPPRRYPSERTTSGSTPSRRPTPLDLRQQEEQEHQLQRLDDVESRLQDVEASVREAEDRRELAFRQNEDDRYRIFVENQERRDQEAREHTDRLLETIDSRLASLLPAPPAPVSEAAISEAAPEAIVGDTQSMIDSVRTASQEAAVQYSRELHDIITAEREEFAREREATGAERERLLADAEAERSRLAEEREARINDLEAQLASVKQELEDEKQRRMTEEAETQERQRQELEERDEAVRNQLGDITNLIQDQRQVCEAKKDLMQAQWEEKQRRRLDKDARWIELRDMVSKLHEDMENDRARTEEYRQEADAKPGYDKIIEELTKQNAEQRELLTQFSESWRADCLRHHEETINAVRQTAQEQVPFNVQGYLDEFSKALATEVRMLLGEVGKLREERRALQHELGFLLTMKSKYGPGGEFEPEWKPGMPPGGSGGPGGPPPGPPGDPPPPEPQPPAPEQQPQVRPGWRPVPRRKKKKETPAPSAGPSAAPTVVDPRHQIQSWATWQPDPQLAPTPPSVEPTLLVPNRGSPGLFGPRTPRSSYYGN